MTLPATDMEIKVQLPIYLFYALLVTANPSQANFEVSSTPAVTGIIGQDVVLPCQISTRKQPDNMEVQWKKIIQAKIENVHDYRAMTNQDVSGEKYQGRAILLKDGFSSGNVSLKLKNIQPADEGIYSCIVKSNEWSADASTDLKIAGVAPVSIDVLGPQDQGIKIACRSKGWFPRPELHWVTKKGTYLQPVTKIEQDRELFFNVLSHITVLGEDTGEISCIIENSLLKTEQKSVILLSGDIFPRVSPWLAAFWVLLTLDLLVIGACAFLGYKVKQKKSKKKSSEEETLFITKTERKNLESECNDLRERFGRAVTELDFRRARSYMVPITLDPNYKHPELTVSTNNRTVQHNPTSPKTSDTSGAPIAVGKEGFTVRGDHDGKAGVCRGYWEVEVGDSPEWELGVLSETERGRVTVKRPPEGVFWALGRSQELYQPSEANTVIQKWSEKPTVIGVFLDLEAGSISFYCVKPVGFIVEIPVQSTERLFPFLSPGYTAGTEKRKPLSICPPSDWDFVRKSSISEPVSQGIPTTPAQPSAPNNSKGAKNNRGSPTTGETAKGPEHHLAPADQDVKEKCSFPSWLSNTRKKNKGNKTEQELLQTELEKATQNSKV